MLCRTVVAGLEISRQIRRNLIVRRGKVGLLLFQLATLRLELGRCSRLRFPKLGKCRGNLLLNCRNLIQLSIDGSEVLLKRGAALRVAVHLARMRLDVAVAGRRIDRLLRLLLLCGQLAVLLGDASKLLLCLCAKLPHRFLLLLDGLDLLARSDNRLSLRKIGDGLLDAKKLHVVVL